jgi:uncharacterized membrane protein
MVSWNLGDLAPSDSFQSVSLTVSFATECGTIANRIYYGLVDSFYCVYGQNTSTAITGGECFSITEIKAPMDLRNFSIGYPRINNKGGIAGWYLNSAYSQQAMPFCADSSGISPLPSFSGNKDAYAYDLNESGDIVGTQTDPATGKYHAVVWRGSTMTDLSPILGNPAWSEAMAINDSGWITGIYGSGTGIDNLTRLFQYKNDQVSFIDTSITIYNRQITDINNAGQIAGSINPGASGEHAFISDSSILRDINPGFHNQNSRPNKINSLGHLVGWTGPSRSVRYAYLYRNGTITSVAPSVYGDALGVNDSDWVVGTAWFSWANAYADYAFLYKGGIHSNLNNHIPNETGWKLIEATDINNRGEIVGIGSRYGKSALFLISTQGQRSNDAGPVTAGVPATFELYQNYPNPFNPTTTIHFTVTERQHVSLRVYDVLGREVVRLVEGQVLPGTYQVRWNAVNAASGVYFYRMDAVAVSDPANLHTGVRKMLLMK